MFNGCKLLKEINVTNINTKNVIDMNGMFYGCNSLNNLDITGFNTQNVIHMRGMFYGCNSLNNLDLSGFNTKNVINMGYMFFECKSLKNLDLSKFNTRKVTDMKSMFKGCTLLKDINRINFFTEKSVDCRNMFDGCDSFQLAGIIYSNIIYANNSTIDIDNIISKLVLKQDIIEYNNKIKFIKEPNLKNKSHFNYGSKATTIEIYTSYIDNKDYIAYSDYSDSKNLKILYFYENKLKKQIGFNEDISEIKYYINKNNYTEYLLIKSLRGATNILYITYNYINIYKYEYNCEDCLLVFPNNYDIFFIYHEYEWVDGYYSDEGHHVSTTETISLYNYDRISFSDLNDIAHFYLLLPWYYKKTIYIILYDFQNFIYI